MKVIDIHAHIFPDSLAERALRELSRRSGLLPVGDGTLNGLVGSMKDAGIEVSVVQEVATRPGQVRKMFEAAGGGVVFSESEDSEGSENIEGSEGSENIEGSGKSGKSHKVLRVVERFCGVSPELEWDVQEKLLELEKKRGVKGIKLHPVYQGISIEDERMISIMRKARELDMMVMIQKKPP